MKQISKVVGCVMGVGLLLVVLGAIPAAAAPCNVPSSPYPTIQAAVDDPTCVIINVAAGTYTEHVTIDHNVMILGAGQESTVVEGSGSFGNAVFAIGSGKPGKPTVAITGVTIQNGSAHSGGGITNGGTLTIQYGTVTGNSANFGGGIYNFGTFTLQNSTVTGNHAFSDGGGILNNDGTLTVLNSTIADNSTIASGINIYGGGIWNAGMLTIVNSSLAGNSASFGGGIAHFSDRLTIANSTIEGNSASAGGGIFVSGGTVTLAHVTFENNTPNDCTGCP